MNADRTRADDLPHAHDLFEGAACGLLLTDQDGTIRRINRTLCVWLGYDAREPVGQRRFQELLTMGGRIFHQTHWVPLLQLQGSVAEGKLEILHRDSHPIPMVTNAVRREHAGAPSTKLRCSSRKTATNTSANCCWRAVTPKTCWSSSSRRSTR